VDRLSLLTKDGQRIHGASSAFELEKGKEGMSAFIVKAFLRILFIPDSHIK
jgi:hypothetical protein